MRLSIYIKIHADENKITLMFWLFGFGYFEAYSRLKIFVFNLPQHDMSIGKTWTTDCSC